MMIYANTLVFQQLAMLFFFTPLRLLPPPATIICYMIARHTLAAEIFRACCRAAAMPSRAMSMLTICLPLHYAVCRRLRYAR